MKTNRSFFIFTLLVILLSTIVFNSAVFSNAQVAENSWMSRAPMRTARAFFGTAVVDGKVYAIGGTGGANEVYDPATDSWENRAPMPNPRRNFAIATYGNKIYIIGGYKNDGNIRTALNEVYDPTTDTWETRASMPTSRAQVSACEINGKIYVIGGITENGAILHQNEVYNPSTDTWTTKTPIPYGTYSHSAVAIDNKIYVISGQSNGTDNKRLGDGPLNQIYNTETDSWTLGANPPQPAHRAGAAVTSGLLAPKRIYVIGGETGFMEATNVTRIYDPQTDTWTNGASMPTARQGLRVAVINDMIYALGGCYPDWNGYSSTTTSNNQQRKYTTLSNTKATPVNFVPQQNTAVNERYTPVGYQGTIMPSPSPSLTPSQSLSPSSTENPNKSGEPSAMPSSEPQVPELSSSWLIITAVFTVASVTLGLLAKTKIKKQVPL